VFLYDGLSGVVPRQEATRRRGGADGRLAFLAPEHDTVQANEHPAFFSLSLSRYLGDECRLRVQLQPVRMSISQVALAFLIGFASAQLSYQSPPDEDFEIVHGGGGGGDDDDDAPAEEPACPSSACPVRIRMCDVGPLRLRVDYLPELPSCHQLVASPAKHLVQWVPVYDVRVEFERLQLSGLPSWEAVLQGVAAEWKPLVLPQVHRYLSGLAPVRTAVKIAAGLKNVLLAPFRPAPLRNIHNSTADLYKCVVEEAASLTVQLLVFSQTVLEGIDSALGDSSYAHGRLQQAAQTARYLQGSM